MQGPTILAPDDQRRLLLLARLALDARVRGRPAPPMAGGGDLDEPHGAFVTIRHLRELRGCLGQLDPRAPLWRTVARLAAEVCHADPRFAPVREDELDAIAIEISVLTPYRAVRSIEDIDVGRHGVVVEHGGRRGVLLPHVAVEHRWDRATFVEHACVKAGLAGNAWLRGVRVSVFEAQVFGGG
jgi:AmmeMemoRadiSam system protein A